MAIELGCLQAGRSGMFHIVCENPFRAIAEQGQQTPPYLLIERACGRHRKACATSWRPVDTPLLCRASH
jgi:hypothetical protein